MAQISFKRLGLGMIALALVGFSVLTVISISAPSAPPRNVDPNSITYNGHTAVEGWQVAQNYDPMDCHTILGNGAYFAPDLTTIYRDNGPAWVRAWLDDTSRFPTEANVTMHLPANQTLEQYYQEFPGAQGDVETSGGNRSMMPRLSFTEDEKDALTAWLQYVSLINTNNWPPSGDNNYSFADSFNQNSNRWPESFDAWVGYWILGVALVAMIMFTFFYWEARGGEG